MIKPTTQCYEKYYGDLSGVEFAIRFLSSRSEGPIIQFERVEKIDFPIEQLDWIISCLQEIRKITAPDETTVAGYLKSRNQRLRSRK